MPSGRGEPDAASVVAAIEACTQTTCEAKSLAHLLADIQIGGNLRDAAAGGNEVEDLAAKPWRAALGHAERSSELLE
jgi:hypothetical protein